MKSPLVPKLSLPGIRFVGVVDCEKLQPNLREMAMAGLTVAAHTDVEAVPFVNATAEAVSECSHGAPVETATLKFRTSKFLRIDIQMGFVITDVSGRSWLIGAAGPPFPKVSLTRKTGLPGGDPAVWEIEVKAVGQRSLLPCVF